jgi:hypothetical protein
MQDPTDINRRVLEKFFLELDPTDTAVSLKTAYK